MSSMSRLWPIAWVGLALAGCPEEPEPKPEPAEGCPEPVGEGTLHEWALGGGETWTAAGSPHVVRGVLSVPAGETLRIERCAVVLFEEDAGVAVREPGAVLEVDGEPGREVRLEGLDGALWSGLEVRHPAFADLRHARLVGAGADRFLDHATIFAAGDQLTPAKAPLRVQDVTVQGSAGPGVVMVAASRFADGSEGLTITGSGGEELPYPLVVGEQAVDSIPDGDYTGNGADEILIREDGADGTWGFVHDTTMRPLGVPYRTAPGTSLYVGGGTTSATLTIEAGVTVRFAPGTQLGVFASDGGGLGVLRVLGTPDEPVVLTSAEETPHAGDWTGVYFHGAVNERDRIEHARIEYAGGWCGCSLVHCNAVGFYEAAVVFEDHAPEGVLTDSRIAHSAGHGVLRGWTGPGPSFADTNEYVDIAGCRETEPPDAKGECPDPLVSCDG